jgi:hypothetical protein
LLFLIFYDNALLNYQLYKYLEIIIPVAVLSALLCISEMNVPNKYLTYVCFILFLASSFLIFNAYAQQQGGAATGGAATSGSNVAGPANCYGQCYFFGGPASGGSATGGNAIGSGSSSQGESSQTRSNPINNLIQIQI